MKRIYLLMGVCFALFSAAKAQELVIDDFENGDKGWTIVNDATATIENNPVTGDVVNGSAKALKVVCEGPGGAVYNGISGPILEGLTIPVGPGAGEYRYAHIKVYYDKTQALALSLESGPGDNFGGSWADVHDADVNKWIDLVIDCQGAPAGNYGKVFIMPGRMNSESWYGDPKASQTFYLDDIRFSNDPKPFDGTSTSITNPAAATDALGISVSGNLVSVSFDAQDSAIATVSVFNVSGQLINQQVLSTSAGINETTVTIADKGIYFVKVDMGNKSLVSKFVK